MSLTDLCSQLTFPNSTYSPWIAQLRCKSETSNEIFNQFQNTAETPRAEPYEKSVSEYSEVRSSLSFSVFPECLNIRFANSENPLRFCLISPRYISRFDYYSSSRLR